MPNNPVQIVLNTRDYFVVPEPGRWGPAKDFFEDRDREFAEHRDRLLDQVEGIKSSFERSGVASGVLKVKMRREAWAKSHRPNRVLFPPNKRPCIAVSGIGELFYLVAAGDLPELETEIAKAENATHWRKSKKSDVVYAAPSDQRSDVGAVESIALPTPADKRTFSVNQAVGWLSDPRTSGAYLVEVFAPPPATNPGVVQYFDRVLREIRGSVADSKLAAETFVLDSGVAASDTPANVFGIKLVETGRDGVFNRSAGDHEKLLSLLDSHAYVRRILLPPIVVAARVDKAVGSSEETPPTPSSTYNYPKIGIIDGGIAPLLGPWILGSHGVLAPDHQDRDHGTFIGGLLVAAKQLNGERVCGEEDGCRLFDISVFPDAAKPETFANYYPKGLGDFIREISSGVAAAKKEHGIRVFNMSLNLQDPVQDDDYGIIASLLDRIADANDVVFVISAGNLDGPDCRQEWQKNPQDVLKYLAARRCRETVLQPSESSRSIAVGALNPPGCAPGLEGVPAAYSRRGPGLRVGVKPDVGHFGGARPRGTTVTGLKAWDSAGVVTHGHGTSYAAPLVAKSLASLEAHVATPMTRETLIGMLIHSCDLPPALGSKELREVARQFAGFGMPNSSTAMLDTPDHCITLVFADVLLSRQRLQFDFAWPQGLVNRETGACRGEARMTLVCRPPLNRAFGAEFVRVNVDAHLGQEEGKSFKNRTKQAHLPGEGPDAQFEHELIEHGLKWWPIKCYQGLFPRGKGTSSNWRLGVESIVRAEDVFPAIGVPFALILTISDLKKTAPVFNDLRLHLLNQRVNISDIRIAPRVRAKT
jgi:subtilase family protein